MAEKINRRALMSGIGAILMSTCSMAPFVMMSLYMEQMSRSIDSTVGMLAIAMSISTAGAVVASLTIGRVLKVLNHRIMIALAGVLVFAFQFTISVSRSIVPIYMVAFLNGFGTTWGGMAMSQIIITQWFDKARGTMMSVCMVVMGLVLTAAISAVGTIIINVGYRPIVMAVGIIGGAGVLLSAFLASGAPEKYGLRPYGTAETGKGSEGETAHGAIPPSLSFGMVIKSPVFWAIILIVVLGTVVTQGFSSQAAVIFGTFGLDPVTASYVFATFTFLGLPWQFVFGFLCDKIGPKSALTICGSVCGIVLLLAFLWNGFIGAIIFAFGLAVGGGMAGLYGPNMAPRLFGVKDVGDIIGFIVMASSVGATIGPLFFGLMYDSLGNYMATLIIMGIIVVICLLLNFWLNSKGNLTKIRRQIEKEKS
ncbi:MAG: MFS transporter [Treponema sp.]|jgi:sugar phosphate permease|nr:MFS transporter [Treponema sp.]